ncbi:hypothetical protein ACLOAU_14675 [Niabella sp. CJ426]|uniref:hypothetical protein n=1 Tax=Niabella sp. CJ426 TaxID=3393740 RepID=UPI003D068944
MVKYKEEFKDQRVAFGKSAAPLHLRDDLHELAILALESGDKSLLHLFEELPTLEELKKAKTDRDLGRISIPSSKPIEEIQPDKKKKVK